MFLNDMLTKRKDGLQRSRKRTTDATLFHGDNLGLEKAIQKKEEGGEGKAERLWEICWEVTRAYM